MSNFLKSDEQTEAGADSYKRPLTKSEVKELKEKVSSLEQERKIAETSFLNMIFLDFLVIIISFILFLFTYLFKDKNLESWVFLGLKFFIIPTISFILLPLVWATNYFKHRANDLEAQKKAHDHTLLSR